MKKQDLRYDADQVITVRHPETGKEYHAIQVLDGTYWVWEDDYDDCVRASNDYMMLLLEAGYIF